MAGTSRLDCLADDRPNPFVELQVFHILGNIVKSADQAEWILQCRDHRPTE